jgi:hypothetical protein
MTLGENTPPIKDELMIGGPLGRRLRSSRNLKQTLQEERRGEKREEGQRQPIVPLAAIKLTAIIRRFNHLYDHAVHCTHHPCKNATR